MNKKSVICLCVFNNEFGLPYCFKNIEKMSKLFKKFEVLIFYDHSTDNSLKLLYDFKRNSKINTIIIINKNKKSRIRTENISYARNSLLKIIKKKYRKYNYFMFMDTNEYSCIGDINIELLKDVIYSDKYDYDSISFNREAGYYDLWALSCDPFIYSIFHFQNHQYVCQELKKHIDKKMEEYKSKNELMEVYSAFNGFAIYKTPKFIDCKYSSNIDLELFPKHILKKNIKHVNSKIINYFRNDCEHRSFHLQAIKKNNAKIRICAKSMFKKMDKLPKKLRGPA